MFSFISYWSEIKIILSCRVGLCDPNAVKGSKFLSWELAFN